MCGRRSGDPGKCLTLLDDLGAEVDLVRPPGRVVSLVPSLTEAIEVTAPGSVVGATDFCTHPSTMDVVRVGGSKYPDLDRVIGLHPELVIANAEENRQPDVAALRAAGIAVWTTEAAATVPAALRSMRRLFESALDLGGPEWLARAESAWAEEAPVRATAVVPVWRRPWVVLGRNTFAGDMLRRLGVANAYRAHADRYPRPPLDELRAAFSRADADLLVLPDEPYRFTADDGPEAFPGIPYVLMSGRHLTWYGPSLLEARDVLADALRLVLG